MNFFTSIKKNIPRFHPHSKVWLLYSIVICITLAHSAWRALLDNFSVTQLNFNGLNIGILQSLREVPGFLVFTIIWFLAIFSEQKMVILSLLCLGLGVILTPVFDSVMGLYATTMLMSFGFHYSENISRSLILQYIPKGGISIFMGRVISLRSLVSLIVFAVIWLITRYVDFSFLSLYWLAGITTVVIAVLTWLYFKKMRTRSQQIKNLVIRKRYWLYYVLTICGGARRQIFVVFGGFLLVQKFNFDISEIAALYFLNQLIIFFLGKRVGILINLIGERRALILEYLGLIFIFAGYAFVTAPWLGAIFYILDHFFFSMAIAIESYFKKIADPEDIAGTVSFSFSLNHVVAVFMPFAFGFVWLYSYQIVFLCGALLAALSLLFSLNIPSNPSKGREVLFDIVEKYEFYSKQKLKAKG